MSLGYGPSADAGLIQSTFRRDSSRKPLGMKQTAAPINRDPRRVALIAAD
jgi:hypothetical protein